MLKEERKYMIADGRRQVTKVKKRLEKEIYNRGRK